VRQIFTSPRLENVEGVAQLLRDAGIEVRITNSRSYKGNRRGGFSYREDSESPPPAVWVVRSEDQVRARELLRDAGLIDSTRDSFAAPAFRFEPRTQAADPARRRATKIRMVLLAGCALGIGMVVFRVITQPPVAMPAPGPYDGRVSAVLPQVATAVFTQEIREAQLPVLCLSVDGHDAPQDVIANVARKPFTTVAGSHCERIADSDRGSRLPVNGQPALLLDVTRFRASGPDTATVEFSAYHHQLYGSYKTLEVRRINNAWKVTKTLKHVAMQGPLIVE